METPVVSVVIDNYNYGRYLKECLDGVLAQDYPKEKLEIILVDDGSTDDSLSVAKEYAGRITVVTQKNSGQAGAFNSGIAIASGELVMLLDSDDYWDRDKVRVIADCFKDDAVGVVQHPLLDVDAHRRALPTILPQWPPRYKLADYLAGDAALAAASGVAVRRSLLKRIGPIPLEISYASDIYLIVFGLFHADALNFPQPKGYHRVHGANNWAEGYSTAKKLRTGLEIQRVFDERITAALKERGLELSARHRFLEDLDVLRRRILLHMREGRRGQAFALWSQLVARYGFTRLGLFRSSTLMLALISPDLYTRAYRRYRARKAS